MKYIAVDFDGCICTNEYPKIGKPNWDVINKLKEKQAEGAKLILWTCREGNDLAQAIEASAKWGLKYFVVNENPRSTQGKFQFDPRKIVAHEYWDDRARNPITDRKYRELLQQWEKQLEETNPYGDGYWSLQYCINSLKEVLNSHD